jgi:hypothetical protein
MMVAAGFVAGAIVTIVLVLWVFRSALADAVARGLGW